MRRTFVIILLAIAAAVTGCAAPDPGTSPDGRGRASVQADDGVAAYKRYVAAQAGALGPQASEFADAVKAGRVERAKALYPVVRGPWERLEPIAESVEDLDARMDGREYDARPPGVGFTGFHRLEKDLWADGLQPDSPAIANQLLSDVETLRTRATGVELTPTTMADGAKKLLEEIAVVKLAGEEDTYAGTDLWDIDANVEGAAAVIDALRPQLDVREPALGPVLDSQFADVRRALDGQRVSGGFRPFAELTPYDRTKLSIAVDALGETVGKVVDATRS